jgi:L-asparaginase/Glu-tRNA(Gln) amidotransferase subunit D
MLRSFQLVSHLTLLVLIDLSRVNKKTRLYRVCQSPVALIHLYPGMDPSAITYAVQRGSRGIILQVSW